MYKSEKSNKSFFKSVSSGENFVEMEKRWLRYWYEKGIVKKYRQKNKEAKKCFSFIDGPITANNPMGVHHAWGRTYKDLWQKFFNLLGYRQRFQNGFDCQGLWVEVEVEKELGLKSKKDIENLVKGNRTASIAKFVDLCKERVYRFAKIQTEQSKRLGYFMDWEHSYFTMSDENNYMIWHFLKKCYENGWIYKGRDSVPWCPRCETAISEHEILTEDYKEITHESVYFKLPLLVWTTTPWTIPANIAVAVDEKIDYSLVRGGFNPQDKFWVAKDLLEKVFQGKHSGVIKTVKGRELVGLYYQTAFDGLPAIEKVRKENPKKFHLVIATDPLIMPISLEEGTGLVHTAVSAGTEDFRLGKKLGLPMIPVIADNADYLDGFGQFSGKNAKKHPELILNYLKEKEEKEGKWVFSIFPYKHRYPVCWRCKEELVWKVTEEWYIAMDKPSQILNSKSQIPNKSKIQNPKFKLNKTLRERMMAVAKKIRWLPEFGLERELDWLKNMQDWLISKKNRYWGLALPIYECQKCGNFEVIGSKEELKKRAVSGWEKFAGHSPHKPWIDEVKIKCQKCGNLVSRIEDVGNPWLDAGIVPFSTICENNLGKPLYLTDRRQWQKWFPADFITESFPGQFKNWFYALIAMATVLENTNPFKTVLGFGTLLGEDGRPMHKSWGNAIEFNEGAEKIGVDVMRWLYARQDPAQNLLFGYKKADEVRRQFYLMLWNVYKFFVEYANLDKLKIKNEKLKITIKNLKLKNVLDKWLLGHFYLLVDFVEESLLSYNAKDAAWEIEKFVDDLSTWYIRRSRERVWVNSDLKEDKQAFYSTLYYVLVNLSIILSPFLPFISEEIYTNLTGQESVHLSEWPKLSSKFNPEGHFLASEGYVLASQGRAYGASVQSSKLFNDMNLVREIVEVGHRVRKEQKLKVRQPLSKIKIKLAKDRKFMEKNNLDQYLTLIKDELNVKKVEISTTGQSKIEVEYDTKITPALKEEGEVRELIRKIQNERKKLGLKPNQFINLEIPDYPKKYEDLIKRKVMAKKIGKGKELVISY